VKTETVLIVEDESTMLRGLKDNFEFEGYRVLTAVDGEQGLDLLMSRKPDLVILDLMLPKINGYEICRAAREEGLETPIIMLTAKGQESDIVLGLNLGADDYVTKPFSIKELLARANAFLRRQRQGQSQVLHFGDCALDLASRRLLKNDSEVTLTPKEFAVLALLTKRAGRAFTREEILGAVWGHDILVTARSVDRCISTLREKIEVDPHRPTLIRTIREIGYRFDLPEGIAES